MIHLKNILIISLFSGLLLFQRDLFFHLKPFIPYMLGFIIFIIGINSETSDFKWVLSNRYNFLKIGLFKFILIPIIAIIFSKLFLLPSYIYIGLILLSASPGGTAASVMSHIANANVNLNICLTILTTLLTPLFMPGITYLVIGRLISISYIDLFFHLSQIIFIPLAMALYFKRVSKFKFYELGFIRKLPALMIFLIIGYIISASGATLSNTKASTFLVLIAFNIACFLSSELLCRYLNFSQQDALAVKFEFGMFDTAITMSICTTFFSPEAGIAAASISISQNLIGLSIAKYNEIKSNRFILPYSQKHGLYK